MSSFRTNTCFYFDSGMRQALPTHSQFKAVWLCGCSQHNINEVRILHRVPRAVRVDQYHILPLGQVALDPDVGIRPVPFLDDDFPAVGIPPLVRWDLSPHLTAAATLHLTQHGPVFVVDVTNGAIHLSSLLKGKLVLTMVNHVKNMTCSFPSSDHE